MAQAAPPPYSEFTGAIDAVVAVFRSQALAGAPLQEVLRWAADIHAIEAPKAWDRRRTYARHAILANLETARVWAYEDKLAHITAIMRIEPLDPDHDFHYVVHGRLPSHRVQGPAPAAQGSARGVPRQLLVSAVQRLARRLYRDASPVCRARIGYWVHELLDTELRARNWEGEAFIRAGRQQAVLENLERVEQWVEAGATQLPVAVWIAFYSVPPVPPGASAAHWPMQPADAVVPLSHVAINWFVPPPPVARHVPAGPAQTVRGRSPRDPPGFAAPPSAPYEGILVPAHVQRPPPRPTESAPTRRTRIRRTRNSGAAPASPSVLFLPAHEAPHVFPATPRALEAALSGGGGSAERPGEEVFAFIPNPSPGASVEVRPAPPQPPVQTAGEEGTSPYWPGRRLSRAIEGVGGGSVAGRKHGREEWEDWLEG
ncbi:hypothetical protein JCM10449v2_000673 [Rhodotorula kratochvilovae]